ncbi:hypothetical protein FJZ36_16845 [Candidatus Poribacteria bacterium]|nr:hypothetical protein [Candidatus Poribacteria bacterium]
MAIRNKSPRAAEGTVRAPVYALGVLLVAVNSYWVMLGSEVWHSTQLTIASLFFNAVFTLLVLTTINALLVRVVPRLCLTRAELLTLYVMVVAVTTISGHTMMGYLLPAIEHPYWFGTAENEWVALFGEHLPAWLVVKDRDVLAGYFQGDTSLYRRAVLHAWAGPVLAWSAIILLLWTVLILTTVFIRRQWSENERLSFPVTQLPLALTEDAGSIFRVRWFWIGVCLVSALDIWQGVAFLNPSLPLLPVKDHQAIAFTTRPWSAIGGLNISFYPYIVGLMYFTPLDLSFSCWAFYLLERLRRIGFRAAGYQNDFGLEQSVGAWIALGLIPLWLGRRYFLGIARGIWTRGSEHRNGSDGEAVSFRSAAVGVLVGIAALGAIWARAGMSLWVFAAYFALYFPMVVGITRSRAEIGPPVHTLIYMDPGRTLVTAFGTRAMGPRNMSLVTLLYPLTRCFRANPMPSQLESLRIAERAAIPPRRVLLGFLGAVAVGTLITFWVYLDVFYRLGAANRARGWVVYMGYETYNRLAGWMAQPAEPKPLEVAWMGGGFAFTMALMVLKTRLLWFPFHPAGYVLTTGEGFGREWFPALISWAMKLTVLRLGGVRAYRRAAPFFLGLLLGDYTWGCLWSLYGLAFGMQTYGVWH